MTYLEDVDAAVLKNATADGLYEMAIRLRSLYPPLILDAIRRLESTGKIDRKRAETLRYYSPQEGLRRSSDLPIPHPLDSDWRLSSGSQDDMMRRVLSQAGREILLLGVPTVHLRIANLSSSTLVDQNAALVGKVPQKFILQDIATVDLSANSADVVFADPPWYLEQTFQFLWVAAKTVVKNGLVFLTTPGLLTRPGIANERIAISEFSRSLGLRKESLETGALIYDSPQFETASLDANGLSGFPSDWRRGDLLTFRKLQELAPGRPTITTRAHWAERAVDGKRVRLKGQNSPLTFDPRLVEIQAGGSVRRSVSMRDPILSEVQIWTSDNEIFGCRDVASFLVILDALSRGDLPAAMIERHLGRTLTPDELHLVDRARVQVEDLRLNRRVR